jgi:hypothetical protein
MIITLPKIGSVRFRDDLTDEQFKSQLEALSKKYDFERKRLVPQKKKYRPTTLLSINRTKTSKVLAVR